jgi:hypothetical protein
MKEATVETLPEFDSRDSALLQELRDAVATGVEVPVAFAVAAKASFTWRTIDAELDAVSLCFDSALDGQALVRGPATQVPRSLSFDGTCVGLDVEVREQEISGQVVPAQPATVVLRSAAGQCQRTTADESGWFSFRPTPHGPHRFECQTADAALTTEWTLI